MAEMSRNGRPNRPNGMRSARTGMVALLALGAGAGCGQTMLRPGTGPGLAAQALGQVNEDVPGRQLGWNEPGQISAREALVAKGGGSAKTGLPPAGPISLDGVTAGPPPSPMIATFDGSTFARTTWNGWKLPNPKPFGMPGGPLIASASGNDPLGVASRVSKIEAPRPMPSAAPGIRLVDESLLAACRESKIAPPMRRVTTRPAVAPVTVAAVDGLAAACRESKIAPPQPKTGAAPQPIALAQVTKEKEKEKEEGRKKTAVVTETRATEVKEATAMEPTPAPKVVEVTPTTPTPTPAPAEAQPMPLLMATPTEAPAPAHAELASATPGPVEPTTPAPAETPKPPAPEPLETQAALPDRRPVRLPRRSQPAGSPEAPVTMPILTTETRAIPGAQGAPPPPLDEAYRVTRIDPPRRPEPDSPEEASLMTQIELPHRSEPTPSGPEPQPTPDEASRVTNIELPHRPEPTAVDAETQPTPDEASRVTNIELPHRPGQANSRDAEARAVSAAEEAIAESTLPPPTAPATARVDPLQEACEAAQIPPPIPGQLPN